MAIWSTSRSAAWSVERDVSDMRRAWRAVCAATPGAHHVVQTVTGGTEVIPAIVGMSAGALVVELLPGQLADDLRAVAHRLAPGLGAVMLRITQLDLRHVRVEMLARDPLAGVVEPVAPVEGALSPLVLGRGEHGHPVILDLATAAHIAIQGSTGSGKSVAAYSLLGQLATAPDVVVTGSDVSGLLLRPWSSRRRPPGVPPPALGTRDLAGHVGVLELVVAEMDRRISSIPPGHDEVSLGPTSLSAIVVVIEELPGLYRAVEATGDKMLNRRLRAAMARLMGESRKAGIRLLLICQRADAAILGAYERSQCSHRLSYRVDTLDAVRMLHADAGPDVIAQHTSAPPGIALATVPGQPLTRLRSPYVTYADYCTAVAGHGGHAGLRAVPA